MTTDTCSSHRHAAQSAHVLPEINAVADEMVQLRHHLHQHPELAFEEFATSDLVAERLSAWGYEVHRGLGGTGVVGTLRLGNGPMRLGLRADMDALPMQEFNIFAHASQHEGKMHACGHDGHTAMLLAAAQHLAKHRNCDGTVYVIFQPAEEGGGGAREMIKDGLFKQFPMQAVFGMHNWPGAEVGTFAVSPGPVMASSNEFKITVHGKGSHAALPHNGVDPIVVASQMVQAFQNIITRNKKPVDAGVISVTMIHAGHATNVIPDACEMQGTVRTFTLEVLDLIERRMKEVAEHICAANEARCEFEFVRNYPPTINHVKEAAFMREVMGEMVGADNVMAQEPTMGAEDFSFMLQEIPGAYAFIANGDGAHREMGHGGGPCTLHNPSYDFNDELIPLGGSLWVKLVEKWFQTN